MGLYKPAGFVVTTPTQNFVHDTHIDQATLARIAELLGIPRADKEKLTAESIRTIFIYSSDK
jgi:hypothetical protein